jgi:hypothetical protein
MVDSENYTSTCVCYPIAAEAQSNLPLARGPQTNCVASTLRPSLCLRNIVLGALAEHFAEAGGQNTIRLCQ